MNNVNIVVSFLLLSLFLSSSSWGLSPSTSVDKPSKHFESFETSLSKGLKEGFFQRLFKTEEPLVVDEVLPMGDSHYYFKIESLERKASAVSVTVSYLVKDRFSDVKEERLSFYIEGDYRLDRVDDFTFLSEDHLMRQLYHKIDAEILKIFYQNSEMKQRLFENYTRKVVFKTKNSAEKFILFYKFGEVTEVEAFSIEVMSEIGMPVPKVHLSKMSHHLWLESIPSDFPTKSRFTDYGQWDLTEEEWSALFAEVGFYQVFLYVLGHDDFHPGNFLLSSRQGVLIDFETVGKGAIFDQYTGNVASQFLVTLSNFTHLPEMFLSQYPYDITKGVLTGIRHLSTQLPFILKKMNQHQDLFYSRLLVRATFLYEEEEILPVPHYTSLVQKEDFIEFVLKRYRAVVREFERSYFISSRDDLQRLTLLQRMRKISLIEHCL